MTERRRIRAGSGVERALDRAHLAVTRTPLLQAFTAATRVLLAIGFIPPSIPKILGQPFTSLPDSDPVGRFFGALHQTGFYYEFIGWGQILAAGLLLFPRTAHLGALLFLPIIANIAVLTLSVGFAGTWVVASLMLLAVLYLVAWDYDRLKTVLFRERPRRVRVWGRPLVWLPLLGACGGGVAAATFVGFGVANLHRHPSRAAVALTLGGALFGLVSAAHYSFMREGTLEGPQGLRQE